MTTRLGVDVGGTFSDLVFYDDATGEVRVGKGLTTSAAPEDGVISLVSSLVDRTVLSATALFLHGTTVGINAVLERKGAVVGLLTTAGFRDVLEIRRAERDSLYDPLWQAPPPLVPRRLRLPVRERVRADGSIDIPVHEDDMRRALEAFLREGVECVAVVFLHAYANPDHELAAERVLREEGFAGEISLSHRVSGEFREYERTSTTVIDAYVRPGVSGYLSRLDGGLQSIGFRGASLVTRSGGGSMTFQEAEFRPFETIMSGPVAGAVGAAELCRNLGVAAGITADVGGTSFDTCLIRGGRPQLKHQGLIAGMPLQAPWIDVRSIGAGGGSIAYVDAGGLLHVGPKSAGADPGPACYGRGGAQPTVTDAAAALGLLAFGELAGGVRLDVDLARAALEPLADRLGLDVDEAAQGVLTVTTANMADAIRSVTVEQGEDPRDAMLLVFGGAGPLFGTLLARELEIRRIVVPKYAGNFSAWGLLGQDVTRSAGRTMVGRLDDDRLSAASDALAGLFGQLSRGAGGLDETVEDAQEGALDLRYVGQEYTLAVPVPTREGRFAADSAWIRDAFTTDYERSFGHTVNEEVEIVTLRATTRRPLPRRRDLHLADDNGKGAPPGEIKAYSFTLGEWLRFAVLDRGGLGPGASVGGPAILLEETATTYVDAEFEARVDESGVICMDDARGG